MIYTLILTFALSGYVADYTKTCGDLPCVAVVMMHARESPALTRLRVFSGKPKMQHSGEAIFPPIIDETYL